MVPVRPLALLAASLALSGCLAAPVNGPAPQPLPAPTPAPVPVSAGTGAPMNPRDAASAFISVAERMEPSIERECLARTRGVNCDFQIAVDNRPGQPPNAYQTLDAQGRPLIAFTVPLIAMAHNAHELAFVMGHEAAHHIAGHIARGQQDATLGGLAGGILATALGAGADTVRTAQDIGATVGARSYSKDYELEADRLGTALTARAGYDPVIGAQFFTRIPDPGDRFLGTHPPNAQRVQTVTQALADMQAGRL